MSPAKQKPKQRIKKTVVKHHQRAVHHYKRVMPNKKSHRILIWVIFLFISTVIAAQLLYPADRSLPFAKINNKTTGFQSYEELAGQLIDKFIETNIRVATEEGAEKTYDLMSAGAELKTDHLVLKLNDYPIWERLIPFSILWQRPEINEAEVFYTKSILKQFSASVSKDLNEAPKNASLSIKNGQLIVEMEKFGTGVSESEIFKSVSLAKPRLGKTTLITIKSEQIKADVTIEDLAKVKDQAEIALNSEVSILAREQVFKPSKTEVASWLTLKGNHKKMQLVLSRNEVLKYIATLDKTVGEPAGRTHVTIVDGQETSRQVGKSGRAIDSSHLIQLLEDFLLNQRGEQPIPARVIPVAPLVVYNNRYTSSEAGLQAYLNDVGRSSDIRVMVQQIGGSGWKASTRATESTPSASTYKLFVALMLFDKMQKGQIKWTDPMLDTTVSGCFDRMTIASTNPCAESWLNSWGRSNVNKFIYSKGFSTGTRFNDHSAVHTTASDLTKFMIGLHTSSLVSGEYRTRLLHSLGVHSYQSGVPTGSKAGTVYNKVGFLWDYTHDTAIVHHPNGLYVITVMTKGYSYAKIAEITRQVELLLYPN